MKNTKKQGQFTFLIYKKAKDKFYTGVCLDLDIVEENEDPVALRKSLVTHKKSPEQSGLLCYLTSYDFMAALPMRKEKLPD